MKDSRVNFVRECSEIRKSELVRLSLFGKGVRGDWGFPHQVEASVELKIRG